jgi:biotin transport system permease protein
MKAFYVEGRSWMHRLQARPKFLGLMATGVITMLVGSHALLIALLVAGAATFASVGLGWRQSLRRLSLPMATVAILSVLTMLLQSFDTGTLSLLRLTILLLASAAVTATTTASDVMDEVTLAARPLERLGLVRASDLGLAVGLVIRLVPEVASRYQSIRMAHAARGIPVKRLTIVSSLVILTLRDADEIAAAIDSRGLRSHDRHDTINRKLSL